MENLLKFLSWGKQIRHKFSTAGYPMRFVNSMINDIESKEHDPMISNYLFNDFESKPIVLIDMPICNENERVSKQLLKKLKAFTKEKYNFRIVWKTKKVRRLFPLKQKNPYPSCIIYEGFCSCKENDIGETKRNVITRCNEYENPNKDSEPAKHLFQLTDHVFQWKILMSAPMNNRKRKNLEALLIAVKHPTLNEQKD